LPPQTLRIFTPAQLDLSIRLVGQPDPPSSVQVEVGPQPESLLVTWKPVLTQPKPPSRAAIDGYFVLGDGKIIAQVPSAAGELELETI